MRIITDRGTAFTSKTFENFCHTYGIKHVLNAVVTPRANGQCERYNRTILSSLAALNGGMEDDSWDEHVKTVQMGLNSTINRAIGMTPSELLFGSKHRSVSESVILGGVQDSVERLNLSKVRASVKDKIDIGQQKQKVKFDMKRIKAPKFDVGTLVLVRVSSILATGKSE